ncbi:MAG: hypothetical protein KDN20_11520 [Verrucomicrobiae bacterium]|nr:hypothetical protein [Verrucomicrobiae bacterium]
MKAILLISSVLFCSISVSLHAQSENPAVKSVQEITAPAPTQTVRANIVPLMWKASIEESIITVPLRTIEFFGIQDYDVDGATRVRELTISTDAQSLIRIYHIRPLPALANRAPGTLEALRRVAEGGSGEELDLPVKVFPTTTHTHMVEYRVSERSDIDALYQHLEAAMVEYHARDLVPEQREQTVRSIKVAD